MVGHGYYLDYLLVLFKTVVVIISIIEKGRLETPPQEYISTIMTRSEQFSRILDWILLSPFSLHFTSGCI